MTDQHEDISKQVRRSDLQNRIADGEKLMRRGYAIAVTYASPIDRSTIDWFRARTQIDKEIAAWRVTAPESHYGEISHAIDRAAVGAQDGESISDAHARVVSALQADLGIQRAIIEDLRAQIEALTTTADVQPVEDRWVVRGLSKAEAHRVWPSRFPAPVEPVPLRPAITEDERSRLPWPQYIRRP